MIDRRFLMALLFLAVVVLLNLPLPASLRVKSGVRDNLAPFQNGMSLLTARLSDAVAFMFNAGGIMEEKRRLEKEVAALRHEARMLRGLEEENAELRRHLGFARRQRHELILCRVVSRGDASGWWQSVQLDKGWDDGVGTNMAVVTIDGVAGRTVRVTRRTCDVQMITDPECRVSCRISRTGSFGIVRGSGGTSGGGSGVEMLSAANPCEMDYVSKDYRMEKNDEVKTSGLGGSYPAGLPVGRILRTAVAVSGLYQTAEVEPAADLEGLRYVFVVKERRPAAAGSTTAGGRR